MHNLTKVERTKSSEGLLSDYPHYYKLKLEGKSDIRLHAIRSTENGEFLISSLENDFTIYGRNHIGTAVPNFLGTKFEVYNYGVEQGYVMTREIPDGLIPLR